MDREGNEVRSAMNWRYFGVLRVQESPAQRVPGGIAKENWVGSVVNLKKQRRVLKGAWRGQGLRGQDTGSKR